MSALLLAEPRSFQREITHRAGERREASVETHQGVANEQSRPGETVVIDFIATDLAISLRVPLQWRISVADSQMYVEHV